MEEEKIVEQSPVEENYEEKIHEIALKNRKKLFEDFEVGIIHLRNFTGVSKFKSIRRAMRRGLVSLFGDIYPRRPFNNRKQRAGSLELKKKRIYEAFKRNI